MANALFVGDITITVSNLKESVEFFTDLLEFELKDQFKIDAETASNLFNIDKQHATIKAARLQLGTESIVLQEFVDAKNQRKIPTDVKSNDLIFQHIALVVSDMDKAYQKLKEYDIKHVSKSPQTLPEHIEAAAGISAFYFHDLDNHFLELIQYPEGKGNEKWQNTDALFLGIDHTAIGISNTEKQLDFYKLIGLELAGKSENHGEEQAILNNVDNAHLDISGLTAQNGMGVEFLKYIHPGAGKKYPKDSKATDLWHWHIPIEVENIQAILDAIPTEQQQFISNQITPIKHDYLHMQKAFLLRDVDGHAVMIYEK